MMLLLLLVHPLVVVFFTKKLYSKEKIVLTLLLSFIFPSPTISNNITDYNISNYTLLSYGTTNNRTASYSRTNYKTVNYSRTNYKTVNYSRTSYRTDTPSISTETTTDAFITPYDLCTYGFHICDPANAICEITNPAVRNIKAQKYSCACKEGFKKTSTFSCEDQNECRKGTNPCSGNTGSEHCTNKIGSYSCSCGPGYIASEGCEDVNECRINADVCDYFKSVCINSQGSFRCDCFPAYKQINSHECELKDESNIKLKFVEIAYYCLWILVLILIVTSCINFVHIYTKWIKADLKNDENVVYSPKLSNFMSDYVYITKVMKKNYIANQVNLDPPEIKPRVSTFEQWVEEKSKERRMMGLDSIVIEEPVLVIPEELQKKATPPVVEPKKLKKNNEGQEGKPPKADGLKNVHKSKQRHSKQVFENASEPPKTEEKKTKKFKNPKTLAHEEGLKEE